jgi:membrane-bound serine protease (ClpP class)
VTLARGLAITLACLALLSFALTWPVAAAPAHKKVVVVIPIEGMIDLGLAPFVERVLADAEKINADAVIVEVNTFGGRVDAAVQIRDALLRSRRPTVAFVNKRAISAGALISLAAEPEQAPTPTVDADTAARRPMISE